jgi:APA family basic amino acid/polyamine antiporter
VLLICFFIVGALFVSEQFQDIRWIPNESDLSLVGNGSFAIALIYVSYAYTGWNAATYLAGEIKHVQTDMPKILVRGTLVVTLLYILLHLVFLLVAPMSEMQGKLEVGYVAASYAFGAEAGRWFSLMLSVLLISTASAMIVSGPRTLQRIGQDFALLSFLSKENAVGIPQSAILFQLALTSILIVSSSFEAILMFSGFALGLNTLMTVLGVWYLRRRYPLIERPFQVPWYPWPMIIFVGLMLWTLIYVVIERPVEGLLALALVIVGWCFYLISQRWQIQE